VKLFQIEEPDGSPADPDAPGAAVGIAFTGAQAEVAVAVGGNAVILPDREGFESDLPVPPLDAPPEAWRALFEGARIRAERNLGRPVTHAALILVAATDPIFTAVLHDAAAQAGLRLLHVGNASGLAADEPAACAAAIRAEDLAPPPAAP
jgi:hypothetical protein